PGATSFVKPYDELQPLVAIRYEQSLHRAHGFNRECLLDRRMRLAFSRRQFSAMPMLRGSLHA
ncbi:MAG: hypothetical protein LBV73_05270, partial [Paraburkholderia sp.]|nr:hypothetical protein [Paraburkholderia sp.]